MCRLQQNLSSNPGSAAVMRPREAASSLCASFSSSDEVLPHTGVRSKTRVPIALRRMSGTKEAPG